MAAVGQFRAGKASRILIGSTNCTLNAYSIDDQGGDLDTTNFESWTDAVGDTGDGAGRSFEQGLIGIEVCSFNCDGAWNADANYFDDPPGIYIRDDGPAMKLYLNRVDDTFYDFPSTRILSAKVGSAVKDLVTFSFSAKSQGPYVRPTGST